MFKSDSPQKTRIHLLKIAEKLFAKRGFHGVTVRDIAKAAKTNIASIHYHFGDMYGLFEAILRLHMNDVHHQTEKAKLHLKKPDEHILAVAQHMQKMLKIKGDFSRVVHHALISDGDPKLKKVTKTVVDAYMRPLIERLRFSSAQCRWKHAKKNIPVDGFAFVIVSMMHYFSLFANEFHTLFDRTAPQLRKDVATTLNQLLVSYVQCP